MISPIPANRCFSDSFSRRQAAAPCSSTLIEGGNYGFWNPKSRDFPIDPDYAGQFIDDERPVPNKGCRVARYMAFNFQPKGGVAMFNRRNPKNLQGIVGSAVALAMVLGAGITVSSA